MTLSGHLLTQLRRSFSRLRRRIGRPYAVRREGIWFIRAALLFSVLVLASTLFIGPAISGNYQASMLYVDALEVVGGLFSIWLLSVALGPVLMVFVPMLRIRLSEWRLRHDH